MTPERYERAKELFLSARELPEDRRASYLDRHCGADDELRREVESLLAYHDAAPARDALLDAPPEDEVRPAAETVGRFRILGRLGKGGMGEVFLAHDPRLGRRVALKALPAERAGDAEARRRLESEARALAALNHPHVAGLYELIDVDGRLYLVLEHVEGETLAARLERSALTLPEALEIAAQIASGLEAAYAAGVIHRDLKPLNVMITPAAEVKVLDFGLAKRAPGWPGAGASDDSTTAEAQVSTLPGLILGTPAYLSPEQARGQSPTAATDVWAFGCLLFECLTGRQVFDGATLSDTIARILEGEPEWSLLPSEMPPSIRRLLRRCLTKDPRRRLQHPGDVRIEIEETLERLSSPAAAAERSARTRRRLGLGLAAVALAVLAAAIGVAIGRGRGGPPPVPAAAAERRLSIRLPDEYPVALAGANPLAVSRPALALSPAGDHLVWVAATGEGTQLVYRALDGFEVEPLPGTEGAFGPFFSPDGAWVGFFSVDYLRKVPLRGGVASSVTAARNPFGAAWADDGTIYFVDAEGAELVTVQEDGRGRSVLPLPDRSYWPQALPAGRGLLVSAPVGIRDPRTGDLRPLTDGRFARYLDTGHLLYLREESNLLLAPLDLDTLELGGPPVAVLEDAMGAVSGAMQLAVARGGTVAYLPGPQVIPRSLVWADAGALVSALAGTDAYGALALSPQGDRLAVEVRAPGADIWVFDLAGKGSVRLTHGGTHWQPAWSGDGTEVYYCSSQDGSRRAIGQRADGTGEPRRLLGEVTGCPVTASKDGRWLVFLKSWDLYLAGLSEPVTIRPLVATPAYEWGGRISPDGRWFAYTSDAAGRYEIYVRPFPEGEQSWRVSTAGGEEPTWTSDGRSLVYRNGRRFLSVSFSTESNVPRFGPSELIVEGDFFNLRGYSYDVSPTDSRLLLLRAELGEAPDEIRLVENWIRPR